MHSAPRSPSPPESAGIRVSLACIPCRSRHVRCDGKKPHCNRCSKENKQCSYEESRRGGLTRATLAARRYAASIDRRPTSSRRISEPSIPLAPPLQHRRNINTITPHSSLNDGCVSRTETNTAFSLEDVGLGNNATNSGPIQLLNISRDPFIDLYYKRFHRLHPCVLPRRYLEKLLEDATKQMSLKPLVSIMQFIGSLFAQSDQSHQFKEAATAALIERQHHSLGPDAFVAQYHLLSSIALYWTGEELQSREQMNSAIRTALELGMHCHNFAVTNGCGDPVLQESWRRTWWQIYIVDAYYAAIKHVTTFPTCEIEATTELPCEEDEYESGVIPLPMTLGDFNSREFGADNHVYSSFAYLIGATRALSSAIARALLDISNASSQKVLEEVDVAIDGWMLLLPDSKRQILCGNGEIDENMFQAHMAVHAATVGIHRRFSELHFDPFETMSGCSPTPPDRQLRHVIEFETIHTTKCLKAIEAQVQLLALPTQPWTHTPFTTCMLATGTISLLSACKFYLAGHTLLVARDQIRMSIGYLKSLAKVWQRAERTMQEVQTIARQVLSLPIKDQPNTQLAEEALLNRCRQLHSNLGVDPHRDLNDNVYHLPALDDLQAFPNLSDLNTDTAWLVEY